MTPRIVLDSLSLRDAERTLILEALRVSGSLKGAAELLGISLATLRYRLKKFDLTREAARS